MHGRGGRLSEGAETGTKGIGEEGKESAAYDTGFAMWRPGRN